MAHLKTTVVVIVNFVVVVVVVVAVVDIVNVVVVLNFVVVLNVVALFVISDNIISINVNLRLLKASVEFLWWVVCKFIFVSNPTTVLRLCCVVVWVVTIS